MPPGISAAPPAHPAHHLHRNLQAIGRIVDVSQDMLGATVLAWGEAVPELVATLSLARSGQVGRLGGGDAVRGEWGPSGGDCRAHGSCSIDGLDTLHHVLFSGLSWPAEACRAGCW